MKINKNINHKHLWLVSMTGMSMGFFSTLIIGCLFSILGIYSKDNIFIDIKKILTALTSFGIGIGIGLKAKSSPLQILAIAIVTTLTANSLIKTELIGNTIHFNNVKVGFNTNFNTPGDVLAAWVGGVAILYFFEVFKWESTFDFLVIPLLGVLIGILNALWLTYLISMITSFIEFILYHTANQSKAWAIALAPIIGLIMGLALSLPTSSAAMAIALKLHGDAAVAAMAGTAAQMISFGLMTYWATKSISTTLAVGLGTSMLHMANYSKKPILLVIPAVASIVCALIGTAAFSGALQYIPGTPTSGMGSAVLYGQIFSLNDNGWSNHYAWLNVIFIQLLLPLVITSPLLYWFAKKQFIRKEYLYLWNNTQQNTLVKQAK